MYIPYADITIFNTDYGHASDTISAHWAFTALYNGSPIKFAMFAPDAKSVVDHIDDMSPPASNVPDVDKDLLFALARTELIAFNFLLDADVSFVDDAVCSPMDADVIARTSSADFVITSRFKSRNVFNESDVWFNADCFCLISFIRAEHAQRRYVSSTFAQNWSMHVKYAA
jgi:hypothetical protein